MNFTFKNMFTKKKKAVTIIETLITLLAITIMIAGPITFVAKSFQYSSFVRGKIFATGLSQEGLEIVTALRNGSTDANFIAAITPCFNATCSVDVSFIAGNSSPLIVLSPCSGSGCRVYKNPVESDSLYRQNLAYTESTDYYRTVTITPNFSGINASYTVKSRTYIPAEAGYLPVDVTLEKTVFLFNKQ